MEERKKENLTELQQPNIEAEVYNNNKMCDWIYTYMYNHKQNQNSPAKIEHNRSTGEQRKPKIISTRTKLKHKLENKTKARCQLGNKAMRRKLTKYWEERKERIDMQS